MSKVLPSLWLLGAVAYAAATLILAQTFYGGGGGSEPDVATETMRAKDQARIVEDTAALAPAGRPAAGTELAAFAPHPAAPKKNSTDLGLPELPLSEGDLSAKQLESVPSAQPRDEWVKVAGSSVWVRSEPSASAPVLYAYPVGRPLRVIERNAGFARVQDLGGGQVGWIEEAALAPDRKDRHQVAVHGGSQKPKGAATARRNKQRLAEIEFWDASIAGENREQPPRVVKKRGGLAGILRRAFRPL